MSMDTLLSSILAILAKRGKLKGQEISRVDLSKDSLYGETMEER
jgi:hypothetical protein